MLFLLILIVALGALFAVMLVLTIAQAVCVELKPVCKWAVRTAKEEKQRAAAYYPDKR